MSDNKADAAFYFYREDPDSMRLFRLYNEAERVRIAIAEYDNWLRSQIKYEDRTELEEARNYLYDVFYDFGLTVTGD